VFFGVPDDDVTLISGKPKAEHYIAESGKGLYRNFCPDCGARVSLTDWRASQVSSSLRLAAWTVRN